jgi:hypothetical protein
MGQSAARESLLGHGNEAAGYIINAVRIPIGASRDVGEDIADEAAPPNEQPIPPPPAATTPRLAEARNRMRDFAARLHR